jgi:hypothetical protein
MLTMALTQRVHFLTDPEQFAALEALAQARRRATGENVTLGLLLREAVAEYLAARKATPTKRKGKVKRGG